MGLPLPLLLLLEGNTEFTQLDRNLQGEGNATRDRLSTREDRNGDELWRPAFDAHCLCKPRAAIVESSKNVNPKSCFTSSPILSGKQPTSKKRTSQPNLRPREIHHFPALLRSPNSKDLLQFHQQFPTELSNTPSLSDDTSSQPQNAKLLTKSMNQLNRTRSLAQDDANTT